MSHRNTKTPQKSENHPIFRLFHHQSLKRSQIDISTIPTTPSHIPRRYPKWNKPKTAKIEPNFAFFRFLPYLPLQTTKNRQLFAGIDHRVSPYTPRRPHSWNESKPTKIEPKLPLLRIFRIFQYLHNQTTKFAQIFVGIERGAPPHTPRRSYRWNKSKTTENFLKNIDSSHPIPPSQQWIQHFIHGSWISYWKLRLIWLSSKRI